MAPALDAEASGPPVRAFVLDAERFGGPWVALGTSLVERATGRRVRAVPPGSIHFSDDAERFVVVGPREVVVGRTRSDADDFSVPLTAPTTASGFLSASGRTAMVCPDPGDAVARALVVVVDGARKFSFKEERAQSAAPLAVSCALWDDGSKAAWADGSSVLVRDFDAGATREFKGPDVVFNFAHGDGDVGVLFGDTAIVFDLASGAELLRHELVNSLAVDGRNAAWADAHEAVLYSLAAKRVLGRVKLEPDPSLHVDPYRWRFGGVCGGGELHILGLRGHVAVLERECSLVDGYNVDLVTGRIVHEYHHTPADEADEEDDIARACKKAKVACPSAGSPSSLWLKGRSWIVLPSVPLAVFEARTGRRVAELARSADQPTDAELFTIGDNVVGVDRLGVARVWDATTGRVLYEETIR